MDSGNLFSLKIEFIRSEIKGAILAAYKKIENLYPNYFHLLKFTSIFIIGKRKTSIHERTSN